MDSNSEADKIIKFRWRKIVHYSLILSILLIQLLVAGYFYNEFTSRKNLHFIENQLNDVQKVENLTENSRQKLFDAQENFQNYVVSGEQKFLQNYFTLVKDLAQNLDRINEFKTKNLPLINILSTQKNKTPQVKDFKKLIDSTYQYSTSSHFKVNNTLPQIKKFDVKYELPNIEVQTKTYSDTLAKKGLFGRLKDAVVGKENVRKDSTVVIMKQGRSPQTLKIQSKLDSVINVVNNHYYREIKTLQNKQSKKEIESKSKSDKYFKMFNNLLVYSNDLVKVYETSVKESKSKLEKEIESQTSASIKIRKYLVLGLMILMFFVSILIMYFTRMAFIYEKKLKAANILINENLNFRNRILGMLSHELRSPLKIIGIFINKIKNKTDDIKIKDYLKSISFTNNTLLIQANQILEYTKNQQVENKLISVAFNLKAEVHSILNAIEPYVETRNNKFIINEKVDDVMVFSDNTKINQIFINILGNANKFTENGQIWVDTKTERISENKISLITSIRDSGVGISESDLEKIFKPYYQGVLSDEIDNLGAGLGLSLCKEIIELYDGKITVESEKNKGTTVNFTINLDLKN
ncbi:Histidine kinase-, DNA gyrase B-, and HSP90-like ATPase [Halpernia humi]|uniref:histidine kinase n=1 Tax=Halpernia humi TaxID=493375 RepID=A0A1H6BDY6_9FLAO|nr:HAMP domain-containing sensor histidine kinase [Halpernia humi]SEG58892.1 Histidine kinase-, DNA gyrase B-, and HSP90-like ATPase [Halpernia humi]